MSHNRNEKVTYKDRRQQKKILIVNCRMTWAELKEGGEAEEERESDRGEREGGVRGRERKRVRQRERTTSRQMRVLSVSLSLSCCSRWSKTHQHHIYIKDLQNAPVRVTMHTLHAFLHWTSTTLIACKLSINFFFPGSVRNVKVYI